MATTKITSPDLFDLASLNTALQLPNGTTAERPTSPSTGEWRYNTTTNLVEFWDGGEWRDLQSEDIPPVASENFDVTTYTGNGSTQSITGVGFQPDFTWIKKYNDSGTNHMLTTTRIGTGEQFRTNSTLGRNVSSDCITSFDADGFSLGTDSNVNDNTDSFVAYSWKVNGGTSSANGEGSSSSTVEVNTKNKISMFTYSGTGVAGATVGHGLDVTPDMFFMMDRYNGGGWRVWHKGLTSASYYLEWNSTSAETSSSGAWNDTAPTSTVITLGSDTPPNGSGRQFISWAFASVVGFSKFDSYTGNGSIEGPIVETGFEPAFVIIRRIDSGDNWLMFDNKRNAFNPRNLGLLPNSDAAESVGNLGNGLNFLSTGFQVISSDGGLNSNGGTYIYMTFASDASSAPTLSDSFNANIYDGSDTIRSIAGLGFSPSFVWIKRRSSTEDHAWFDTVRGAERQISSNLTAAGYTTTNAISSFNSDGWTTGGNGATNDFGQTYVSWNWKANPIPSINTDGTIQSVVSANQAAGFSIVKYTGNGVNGSTVGHGLGIAPEVVFIKSTSSVLYWAVYSKSNTGSSGDSATERLRLNDSGATATTTVYWDSTAPGSSVFTIGTDTDVNTNGDVFIAYCFTSIAGFSKMSSYVGNSSTQAITGLGFSPNWVLLKETDGVDSWEVYDTARGATSVLYPNGNNAEATNSGVTSFDSDGFTLGSATSANESGKNYIYMAFKENPAQPAVASGEMEYLVVAGGASGASNGGGGGAGGLRTSYGNTSGGGASAETAITLAAGTYTITIGAGGASIDNATNYQDPGNAGSASTISGGATVNTVGGGGGGSNNVAALSGGCGGGGGAGFYTGAPAGGSGTANEGYAGGDGMAATHPYIGGGGGGAGSVGETGNASNPGGGGSGLMVAIDATSTAYAGGGGGTAGTGAWTAGGGAGGSGGGGAGGQYNGNGSAGSANTGGGGGGSGDAGTYTSGAGGSGVIILRMNTSDYSGSVTGSPTVTTSGSETILTYTGSGTYVHS